MVATRPCSLVQSPRSEEHTSELQSQFHLVCRLLLDKKKQPQEEPFAFLLRQPYNHYGTHCASYQLQPVLLRCLLCRVQISKRFVDEPLFVFRDTRTPKIYILSLHDALPI